MMRTDFHNISNGDRVLLYPNTNNPLFNKPVRADVAEGYFYCEGGNPADGPDFYFRDVVQYHEGWELLGRLEENTLCVECLKNMADIPSKKCPGCQAYEEHQR